MFDGDSASGFPASINANMFTSPDVIGKKKNNLKVKFTEEEDAKLAKLVMLHGSKDWIQISKLMETRNPRQCRERWNNYVNPALRTDPWTAEEDQLLDQKFAEFGPRWNKISKFFVNRSDNNIRNRWMMIARHRAKHQKSPMSPAPIATPAIRPEPMQKAPVQQAPVVVIPALKEVPAVEMRPLENTFELFPTTSFAAIDSEMGIDMWNDFTFF